MKTAIKLLFVTVLFVFPTSVLAKGFERSAVSITIGNDFYSAGELVELKTPISDDAYLAGAIVNVDKKVSNDLVAAGSALTITSEIGDDLRALGSVITLVGSVGGDAVLAGGVVNFTENSAIAGDASIAGGMLNFVGSVGGDLQLIGDEINFAGEVGGDAEIRVGKKINFSESAKIAGKLTYFSDAEIEIPTGVASSVERKDFKKTAAGFAGVGQRFDFAGKLFTLLIGFVAGAALLAILGKSTATFASVIREKFWWSLLAGVLALFAPLVAILLFITMLGVWLGGILIVAWILALLTAGALVGFTAGSLIFKQKKETSYPRKLLALAAGAVIFAAIGLIPGFGGILKLTIFVLTLGGLILTKFELYKAAKKAKLV
ncbi:hypothetical protein KKF38_03945 [Patescibacteria group bacterium]|nr:hypothetical protein [Patescibacteria group bacterium]